MKKITLEDVNNAILGTDIKILSTTTILDLSKLDLVPLNMFGVYVINLKYKESYIGVSSCNKGIQGRLLRHVCETWHRNIVESIDIFTTTDCHASFLEKILIKIFKSELNIIMYDNCSLNQFLSIQKCLELNENLIDEKIGNSDNNEILIKKVCLYNRIVRRTPIPVPLYEDTEIYMPELDQYEDKYENRYDNDYENYNFILWLKKQRGRNDPIGDISQLKIKTSKSKYCDILFDAYNEYLYIYSIEEHRKQTENFGLILIDSLNPKLKEQINNDNDFDSNYKILCKKYDEISAIRSKNSYTTWEELIYNYNKSSKLEGDEWYKARENARYIKENKQSIIRKNYCSLLLEINDEIENLLKKYEKNKQYIKESYYYSLINHDINWFSNKKIDKH